MHDTAAAFGAAFFRCYADAFEEARILEVGAGDVNGTLRGCAPQDSSYTGIDLAAGPGVDVVLSDPYAYPFEPGTYDIIVSSSCLEHDQMFWLSFAEMCRVLRAGGFIYLNVPSNGAFHRYPTDNWRFYPDSGLALAAWGRRNGHDIHLVESFIGRRRRDIWNDCILVFGKGDTPRQLSLLAEIFPRSFNIRVGEREIISNYCQSTEDMTLRTWLTGRLESLSPADGNDNQTSPIEALIASLAEREVALDATERAAAERSAAALAGLQRAEEETAGLRAELARAEAEAADLRTALDERVAALQQQAGQQISERDAAIAILQNELAAVRAAVAQAEGTSASMEAAIDGLRRSVASLEHEAEERTADVVTIRDELAAARQVGRSLVAALRTGPVLAPATDQLFAQPQGIFRLIRRLGQAWR
jgi:SAM-dependent methyltransferase